MIRKRTEDYFDIFVIFMEYSCQAASLLKDIMNTYNADLLQENIQKMQDIKHSAQTERLLTMQRLLNEFITPIEREDVMLLVDSINGVIDATESVIKLLYILNIRKVKNNARKMTQIILQCCNALKKVFIELRYYKKSKYLHDLILQVNAYKEELEKVFMDAVRHLYINTKNIIEISSWYQTYNSLKCCYNECQKAARAVEYIVLRNS